MKHRLILFGGEAAIDTGEVVPLRVKSIDAEGNSGFAALREIADLVNLHRHNGRRAVVVEVVEEEAEGYWDAEGWQAWQGWQKGVEG